MKLLTSWRRLITTHFLKMSQRETNRLVNRHKLYLKIGLPGGINIEITETRRIIITGEK